MFCFETHHKFTRLFIAENLIFNGWSRRKGALQCEQGGLRVVCLLVSAFIGTVFTILPSSGHISFVALISQPSRCHAFKWTAMAYGNKSGNLIHLLPQNTKHDLWMSACIIHFMLHGGARRQLTRRRALPVCTLMIAFFGFTNIKITILNQDKFYRLDLKHAIKTQLLPFTRRWHQRNTTATVHDSLAIWTSNIYSVAVRVYTAAPTRTLILCSCIRKLQTRLRRRKKTTAEDRGQRCHSAVARV